MGKDCAAEPHNSVSPSFSPDLGRAEPPKLGEYSCQEPGEQWFFHEEDTSEVQRKKGGLALQKLHNSLIPPESAQTTIPWPRQLTSLHVGGMKWSPENGPLAIPQVDAVCRRVLHPRKIMSAVWESDSAQGSW